MPKEIDESKLNYNKYPGEHVVEYEGVVTIGGDKTFHIVINYKEAFNAEKLEQRFSDLFDKYDYIVGDWGFEQLRLKGFFSTSRKKMNNDNKIDHLEDYINEYCNYGCPYFVLRRIRTKAKNEAFISERAIEEKEGQPKLDRPRRKRNRNKNREKHENSSNANFEIRHKTSEKNEKIKQNQPKKDFVNKNKKFKSVEKKPQKAKQQTQVKSGSANKGFVIRTRDSKPANKGK